MRAVAEGNGGALLLLGEAGIGKSTLVDHLAEQVAGATEPAVRVLRLTGVEVESDLAFAGLATLVSPAARVLDALPPETAAVLRGALGTGDRVPNGLEVHVATLSFLSALGAEGPAVLLVDDAQWIDKASLAVLGFAARRLGHDPVGIVFASRPDRAVETALQGLPTVTVDPFPLGHATELLAAQGATDDVAAACWRATGGNPLAMVEVAAALTDDQRAGTAPLPDPLPVAGSMRRELASRLVALDDETRQALAIAAVEASGDLVVVTNALTGAGLAADALSHTQGDLVEVEAHRVTWTHPLARAAVLEVLTPADLRLAHRRVAAALDPYDSGRIAFHLAAAIDGPDERVAVQLEEVARQAERRGASSAAAEAWTAASKASTDDGERFERLHSALVAQWSLGDSQGIVERGRPLVEASTDPARRARLALIVGQAITWAEGPITGALYLSHEAERVAATDPLAAGLLEVYASNGHLLANDAAAVIASARKAAELATAAGDVGLPVMAAAMESVGRFLLGEVDEARTLLQPLTELCPALLEAEVDGAAPMAQVVAFAQIVDEQWESADSLLRVLIAVARRTGYAGMESYAHDQLGELDWRRGRWAEGASRVAYVLTVGEGSEQPVVHQFRLRKARLDAARGRTDEARAVADIALDMGQRLGFASLVVWSREVLVVAALADGDRATALHHLDALAVSWDDRDLHTPGLIWWQAAYIEELVAAGRRSDAELAFDRLRIDHKRGGRSLWSRAAVARGEAAITAEHPAALEALDRAVEALRELGAGFELGLTLLTRGRRRRAAGLEAEAVRDLAEAQGWFGHLDARPWSQRAAELLGAASRTEAPTSLAARLTDAELRVALAVGSGLTNRQAADELYLSVKTVDSHLQSIYRKLEIRSRSQLAAAVARDTSGAPA